MFSPIIAGMKAVPFYPNLPDDTHCNQAALRMMLKYFLPDREFSWEELEKMTAKMPGKATWPAQMLINLIDMGFDVVMVESFDAEAFVKDGGDYLKREFGAETAEWQIANSDIPQEQRLYKKLLNSGVNYQKRIPTVWPSVVGRGWFRVSLGVHGALGADLHPATFLP